MPTPSDTSTARHGLDRVRRSVVVVDVVESVRLMQQHEDDVIDRWRRFVEEVATQVLPVQGGRLVKSLGDGMLLEFAQPQPAIAAAVDIRRRVAAYNADRPGEQHLALRIGAHCADVVVDERDVYGAGVNLAARLASLAEPGGIVVSAELRDELVDGFDAELEDMGHCWVKHLDHAVHAFRVRAARGPGAPAGACADPTLAPPPPLTPTVAVLPLRSLGPGEAGLVGELIADSVIAALSVNPELCVVSRLSTSALQSRGATVAEVAQALGATYVVSGSCLASADAVSYTVELADARRGMVAWADRDRCALAELFERDSAPVHRLASGIHDAIVDTEARRASVEPLPHLEGYALLLGGVGLLHRSAPGAFDRAHEVLGTLAERVPRHAASHAWLAKWHCLRIIRGQAASIEADRQAAIWRIEQALERDESSSVAWSLRGLVAGFVSRNLDLADRAYARALAHNPNEPLAWLYTATLRSWQERPAEAVAAAEQALRLSPLDPMRYYYESLAAAAFLAADDHPRAIALCQGSLRLNRQHTPTHRVLAIAQMLQGLGDDARATVAEMRRLEPQLTVTQYRARYPGGDTEQARRYAAALAEAGLPS